MNEKQHLITLCGDQCRGCPEFYLDESAQTDKQVTITDDFGGTIAMSKDQLRVFIKKSKEGALDSI